MSIRKKDNDIDMAVNKDNDMNMAVNKMLMKHQYNIILKEQENYAESVLHAQVLDPQSHDYGGFRDFEDRLVHPGRALDNLLILAPLFCSEDSVFYKSALLNERIRYALNYLERIQRPDGTFDLITTNFNSSPDTGFILQNLARLYQVLEKYSSVSELHYLKSPLFNLIRKCGYGIVKGGFHTPNHRWVIASSLMMAFTITGDKAFQNTANQYLTEGIDCDENGEFTERSSGIYNATNDTALILLAQETGQSEYLDYVKRNLDMMFTYIEPDGTVFTGNSTRQDQSAGKKGGALYPSCYYPLYLYMAFKFKDGRYFAMADMIFNISYRHNQVPSLLYYFMLYPELKTLDLEPLPVPVTYKKFYEKSGIVRVRHKNTCFTLLKDNSQFLFFKSGSLECSVKICASFFAAAQFKAEALTETGDGYRLSFKAQGYYRMPFDSAPPSPEWDKMDHTSRKKVNILDLVITVDVKEIDRGIALHIQTKGCDRVPFKVELCFTENCLVEGDDFIVQGKAGSDLIVKSGFICAGNGVNTIFAGPGFAKHAYTSSMRGSEPLSTSDFTVFFTDYTPVDRIVEIKTVNPDSSP